MNDRALRVLEFTKIRDMLAGYALSDSGKELCRELVPLDDFKDINRALDETEEAVATLAYVGGNPLIAFADVSEYISLAEKGSTLNPRALLLVAETLRAARAARSALVTDKENTPIITAAASRLQPLRQLETDITEAILSEEEISDHASPALLDIRRHIRQVNDRIREKLNAMAHGAGYAKYLMESIVTVRNGRYVLPVKAEARGNVPGLVHDQSATGATLFIEPMAVVEMGNELKEWNMKERDEIDRILAAFSQQVADSGDLISQNLAILSHLDFVFAKGMLSREMDCVRPKMNEEGKINLVRVRHPLIPRDTVVPCSLWLGQEFTSLIITGPNTGGKTVTLKTLGLMTLMAQSGLHVPGALGTELSTFEEVYADIGDEQSIEQSLSTFSAHMRNIVQVVEQCDERSLVLFDELGAGTDPAEGAARAIALIEYCRSRGSRVAATTHYAELKVYAMRNPGVTNAACEFDVETLKPTYKLLIGVPGKSNAFAISRRLGLPEEIITSARNTVSQNDLDFEEVLDQLEQQRQKMEQAREEAERLQRETARVKEQSDAYYAEIKKQRERAEAQARREAQAILDEARRTASAVYEELKALRKQMKDTADAQGINARQAELRRKLNEAEEQLRPKQSQPERPKPSRAVRAGDTVELLKLGTKATVLEVNKDGTYLLQAGIMKVTVKPDEVYLLENEPTPVKKYIERTKRELKNTAQSPELDLRGMDALEASAVLSIFLDNAYMANLTQVRIIHGKGTGVLRKMVHEELKKHKRVKKFRLGVYGEGEDGVTIAELE